MSSTVIEPFMDPALDNSLYNGEYLKQECFKQIHTEPSKPLKYGILVEIAAGHVKLLKMLSGYAPRIPKFQRSFCRRSDNNLFPFCIRNI